MAKRRKHLILPWLTANDDDGRFIQVGNSLLLDKRFQVLTANARWLALCMAMECGGKNTFDFSHSTAQKYGFASSTFDRSLVELLDFGYIERIDDGERYQYKPSVYTFRFGWKGATQELIESCLDRKHVKRKQRRSRYGETTSHGNM